MNENDVNDIDLPQGYRWATADETEAQVPGMWVTRTFDAEGNEYQHGEADYAVPLETRPAPDWVSNPDPFGFQDAINWDAVDANLDEIARILKVD